MATKAKKTKASEEVEDKVKKKAPAKKTKDAAPKEKATPAKKAPAKKAKAEDTEEYFDAAAAAISDLDVIEMQQNALSGLDDDGPVNSTGILALDIINGGGLRPAMYTHAGGEQSAKTTSALTVVLNSTHNVPIIHLWDYEGSSKNSVPYIMNIARSVGLKVKSAEYLFGKRDPETNRYVIPPLVRYRPESILERFFNVLHSLLKRLPDKREINRKWYFVYEESKENKAKYGNMSIKGMSKKYGKGIYIPAKDGGLQAIYVSDSWPAMNPESNDDEGDTDNSIALQARAFSKHLKRVKGRLASKRVAIVGINQLRKDPMARYGPSEIEPGGEALKFYSDVRIRHRSNALSTVPFGNPKGEGPLEFEKGINGGKDTYRYVHMKAVKCKVGIPNRQSMVRIWVEDSRGQAWGIDPVWDTLWYLWATGQMKIKNRANIRLDLQGIGPSDRVLNWGMLKTWILGDKDQKKEICADLGYKAMDLRKFCFDQMLRGVGEILYVKHQQEGSGGEDEDEGDD